jgi:polar amino acid transport system substrate-binding protein
MTLLKPDSAVSVEKVSQMQSSMARLTGLRLLLCAAIAFLWILSAGALRAEPLRLVTADYLAPNQGKGDGKVPGFPAEVLGQVFAAMGQKASFEAIPPNRSWTMIVRGERDGMLAVVRTSARARVCSFPDEPLAQIKWFLFVRTADIGKLKFASFADLTGHDIAVTESYPGLLEQPTVSPELWEFLHAHHNMVETDGTTESLRMLAAGRVDYAVANLILGKENTARLGLSGKIAPLLSRGVREDGVYTCFSRSRVSPAFVDAFSRALKQFKRTGAYQTIYQKYFP